MTRPRWLLWLVIGLTIVTICFIWGFHHFHNFTDVKAKDTLIIESAKTLLQVVGVAALGGWLKFLYDEVTDQRRQVEKDREQERARQAAANDIRKGLLDDLIVARSRVEEARRKYRVERSANPLDQYKTTILALLDARLGLSRVFNAIETSEYLFTDVHRIKSRISKMKDYLDVLIKEYENQIISLREVPEGEQSAHLRGLIEFDDFVVGGQDSKYEQGFLVHAYRPAVTEIRKEVLRARRIENEELIVSS